jgi:glyoxylase-like metal-dependent hydrolase (beta-lactamase superfamily II)
VNLMTIPMSSSKALPEHVTRLHELDDVWRAPSAGERLARARTLAPRFRERLLGSGRVAGVRTFDVAMLPYPTAFAFAGAALSPVPYVAMMNRVNVVQFEDGERRLRTLLFNPTDAPRSAATPFFAELRARMGGALGERFAASLMRPAPVERLAALGLRPEDVDYIAFDHMHTQDVRGLLGTTPSREAEGLAAVFPRARLLIWQPELDIFRAVHPLQRPWYIPEAVRHVPPDRLVPCDGDVLLGKGVALVRTPGHTVGNWSLALSTDNGVWTVSENGVAADAYAPEASSIPGLRKYARREGVEVVLNANTLEGRNEQYTSMVLEKSIADRCRDNPDFCQHLPSSELTATPFTPGLGPTYRHGGIESGEIRRG